MLYCEFQAIKNQLLETRIIYFNTQKTNETNPLPIHHFDLASIQHDDDKNNMTETTVEVPITQPNSYYNNWKPGLSISICKKS